MPNKHLLIIYHSQSASTTTLAQAVTVGAEQESNVDTIIKLAFDADIVDLKWADAIIFGSPENFGYMSGALKDFFDRTYYQAQPLQLSLPYALFISAGNDGSGAVREIDRILKGYPMKKIAEPIVVKGEITQENLQSCRDLGQSVACALSQGII
tara:strand:+ start:1044 stop:1505 length:462 start_codon:yes stop_codon:yes gene_type:complete